MPNARYNRRMNETWKDVASYEGLYQVSDLGHVRSLRHEKALILKPGSSGKGYLNVRLCRDGKVKALYIHRLVAEAFIPNPLNLPQVNHKDEDKTNNAVNNLEWCTAEYNLTYGTRQTRTTKPKERITKPKERTTPKLKGGYAKAVLQYDKSGNLVKEWSSAVEVQRQTGFPQSSISKCCRGKLKSTHGYVWKFK